MRRSSRYSALKIGLSLGWSTGPVLQKLQNLFRTILPPAGNIGDNPKDARDGEEREVDKDLARDAGEAFGWSRVHHLNVT